MKNRNISYLATAGAIAAVYIVLTMVFAPISFSEVQIRISEALTILPYFSAAAAPGLAIGCFLANFLGGAVIWDVIFGSIATLIGAVFTRKFSVRNKWLAPVPPIISNTVIVPFVLRFGYGVNLPIPFMMLTVCIGEVISCGVLGMILLTALSRYGKSLFPDHRE